MVSGKHWPFFLFIVFNVYLIFYKYNLIELNKKGIKNMYILKNALVSITRNKGRNLLIAIIVVVI